MDESAVAGSPMDESAVAGHSSHSLDPLAAPVDVKPRHIHVEQAERYAKFLARTN